VLSLIRFFGFTVFLLFWLFCCGSVVVGVGNGLGSSVCGSKL